MEIVVVICLLLAFALREHMHRQEQRELLRRIQSPQQVIAKEAPKREKPERVWTDEQYRQLMLSRGQIPRDN